MRLTPEEQEAWCAWFHFGDMGWNNIKIPKAIFWARVDRARAKALMSQHALSESGDRQATG